MAGGQQGDAKISFPIGKRCRLPEGKEMFLALPANSRPHQRGRRRGEDHLAICGDMIAVGVADENPFRPSLHLVRIKPQAKFRQEQAAGAQFNSKP